VVHVPSLSVLSLRAVKPSLKDLLVVVVASVLVSLVVKLVAVLVAKARVPRNPRESVAVLVSKLISYYC
jgi:hypothetical protein